MEVNKFVLGEFETNCYVVRKTNTASDCLVIDAGLEAGELIDFLETKKLTPLAVVLTHGHADHIAGLELLRKRWPEVKVCIHNLDAEMLNRADINLSLLAGILISVKAADVLLTDGQLIEQAGVKLKVIHTPGHTHGGICLYSKDEQLLFSGDTLFADSVGRADFPGGSISELIRSIKEKLLTLPDQTKVFPGHGPATTIGKERQTNPFLQ
jgi:glyoxylase-like metal-dependent hydrolase (beta-lactamase superfamily II)